MAFSENSNRDFSAASIDDLKCVLMSFKGVDEERKNTIDDTL